MILATIFCLSALILVIFFVSPIQAGTTGLVVFYTALFLTLVGIFSIFGFVFRFIFKKNEFAHKQVRIAFRQACLLAILVATALFIQSQRLLVWWNLLILIILLSTVEYFFTASPTKNEV